MSVRFDRAAIMKKLVDAAGRAAERTILLYQSELKQELSKKGGGRVYRGGRKGQGSVRTRSAPGQPPAVETGELRRSVVTQPKYEKAFDRGSSVVRWRVLGIKRYGFMLDQGTRRIKARPWIKGPKERVLTKVPEIFNRYMTAALQQIASGA